MLTSVVKEIFFQNALEKKFWGKNYILSFLFTKNHNIAVGFSVSIDKRFKSVD